MLIDICIPALGDGPEDARIIAWHKQEGENVQCGELLVELETEKANIELNAEYTGVLHKIAKQADETGAPGEIIGAIDTTEEKKILRFPKQFKPLRQQKQKLKKKQKLHKV